jgi:hypothetical protein
MGRPLGRWARDEDGARTGLPFMLWCVRSYIENPEGQYYSTKSRYCNRKRGSRGAPVSEKKSGNRGTRFQSALSPTRSRESDFLSDEHQLRLPVQLSRVPRGPWARPQAGAQAT